MPGELVVLRWMLRGVVTLALGIALIWALFWPPAAWGLPKDVPVVPPTDMVDAVKGNAGEGARLFANHCVGCHLNGGNVVRRGRNLKQAVLQRNGISGPEDVARIATVGIGRMGGYGAVLGEGGAEAVGRWVWQQALTGWPGG
jgi:cytochrome c6